MHWKQVHDNPNAPAVRRFLGAELDQRLKGRIADDTQFLEEFVSARSVLDIGVVQHDLSQVDQPHWKHAKIKRWSRRCVGIDILPAQVEELTRRGYDVRCVDATSDGDLNERFERIVVGDVLEHVDSPVALLRFAERHLAPSGRILCTTPNPFFLTYTLQALRQGRYLPNAEHVGWITPSMALELAHRAELELEEYWHVQGEGKTLARRLAVHALSLVHLRDAEPFVPSFYYIFRGKKAATGAHCVNARTHSTT